MASARAQTHPRLDVLRWLAFGVVLGCVLLYSVQFPGRWAVYVPLALVASALVPMLARIAGGVEALTFGAFVFALQLKLGFTPIGVILARPKAAGSNGVYVSLVMILAVALIAMWFVRNVAGARRRFATHRPLLRASCAFAACALVSVAFSPWRTWSVFGLFEICALLIVAAVACHQCSSLEGIARAQRVLGYSLVFQSVAILASNLFGVRFALTSAEWAWGDTRLGGTLEAPSVAGTFMAIFLVFAVPGLFAGRTRVERGAAWRFALGLAALCVTLTRSAWIGFFIGSLGLAWTHLLPQGRLAGRQIVRFAAIGVLCVLVTWPLLGQRISEDHVDAAMTRWYLVRVALEMVKAEPLTGIGVNTASEQVWSYAGRVGSSGHWIFPVHNQFLLVAAEMGLPGLIAFVLLFAVAFRAALQAWRSADARLRESAAPVIWSLVAMVWALNLDLVSGASTYTLLFFLIGMACGLGTVAKRIERCAA